MRSFLYMLRYDLRTSWIRLLPAVGSTIAGLIVLWTYRLNTMSLDHIKQSTVDYYDGMWFAFLVITALFGFASIFESPTTHVNRRKDILLIPCNKTAKFFASLTAYAVIPTLLVFLSRYVVFLLTEPSLILTDNLSLIAETKHSGIDKSLNFLLNSMYGTLPLFFTLGGVFIKRFSFVRTLAAFMVIPIAIGSILGMLTIIYDMDVYEIDDVVLLKWLVCLTGFAWVAMVKGIVHFYNRMEI